MSSALFAAGVTAVRTMVDAEQMVSFVRQRDISFAGVGAMFAYYTAAIELRHVEKVFDPRSIRPLALGFAFAEPVAGDNYVLYRFVVEPVEPGVFIAIGKILQMPIKFVGHDLHDFLFCLWTLSMPEPRSLWDTCVAARAFCLGKHHFRYEERTNNSEPTATVHIRSKERREAAISLEEIARGYALELPPVGWRENIELSVGTWRGSPLQSHELDALAAASTCVARIYQHQVIEATRLGLIDHLVTTEMPWVVTTARITWNGARLDEVQCRSLLGITRDHLHDLDGRLEGHGIRNATSDTELLHFFEHLGLLDRFRHGAEVSFDKDQLDVCRNVHETVPLLRAVRRIHDLCDEQLLSGAFLGADGRVHPEYQVLGAHTGRLTSRNPNLPGIGRLFRPLVVPDQGFGIGEVDYCQFEAGIAGAVYGDERLVEMFNSDDLYSAMAKEFFHDHLNATEQRLSGDQFKVQHRDKRDSMKICTLGLIYGLTEEGLAKRMNVAVSVAAEFRNQFLAMFPQLRCGLDEVREIGAIRGGAVTTSGLRRYRPGSGHPSNWERNWFANFPIQGTAANLFKQAGNRLDRLYPAYDARLIVPMHDAFVFEAPLGALQEVAEMTSRVMREAVMEEFPELRPRVEINISHPECWNKEGHFDSIDRWIEDPLYSI